MTFEEYYASHNGKISMENCRNQYKKARRIAYLEIVILALCVICLVVLEIATLLSEEVFSLWLLIPFSIMGAVALFVLVRARFIEQYASVNKIAFTAQRFLSESVEWNSFLQGDVLDVGMQFEYGDGYSGKFGYVSAVKLWAGDRLVATLCPTDKAEGFVFTFLMGTIQLGMVTYLQTLCEKGATVSSAFCHLKGASVNSKHMQGLIFVKKGKATFFYKRMLERINRLKLQTEAQL